MQIIIGLLAGLAVYFLCDSIWDRKCFQVKEYRFETDKIKKDCRFVVLADLHNAAFGRKNKRLIAAIHKYKPDAVLITGDMIVSGKNLGFETAAELLRELIQSYPVYYGLGNHEQKWKERTYKFGDIYKEYEKCLLDMGVRILENESVLLDEVQVKINGLCIEHDRYYKRLEKVTMEPDYIEQLLGKRKEDCYEILLAHNPEYFDAYAGWGADLVLSGHVHGGIVRLPFLGGVISPSLHLFPEYDGGLFKKKESNMVLGRGLGTHTLPLRIWNRAELLCISCILSKK